MTTPPTSTFVIPNLTPSLVVLCWFDDDDQWTKYKIHGWRVDLPKNPWEQPIPAQPVLSVDLPARWLVHDPETNLSYVPGDVEFSDIADAAYYLRSGRVRRPVTQ